MIVLDSSALVEILLGEDPSRISARIADEQLHAPQLLDLEVTQTIRGLLRGGHIDLRRAELARDDLAALELRRYPHGGLLDRIWELRDRVTVCDASFVALAEALGAPLVTTDAKLARAGGHAAAIELY